MTRMSPVRERSQSDRTRPTTTAIVFKEKKCRGSFPVVKMSADGAVLSGDPPVSPGEALEVVVMAPNSPAVRLRARCVGEEENASGETRTVIAFCNTLRT